MLMKELSPLESTVLSLSSRREDEDISREIFTLIKMNIGMWDLPHLYEDVKKHLVADLTDRHEEGHLEYANIVGCAVPILEEAIEKVLPPASCSTTYSWLFCLHPHLTAFGLYQSGGKEGEGVSTYQRRVIGEFIIHSLCEVIETFQEQVVDPAQQGGEAIPFLNLLTEL